MIKKHNFILEQKLRIIIPSLMAKKGPPAILPSLVKRPMGLLLRKVRKKRMPVKSRMKKTTTSPVMHLICVKMRCRN